MPGRPNIVFYGTPEFAVASLDAIVREGYPISGVVTAPDKPSGRGMHFTGSAVKRYALERGLPCYQPENLKSQDFISLLDTLKPDIQVVVAFRMLPRLVWSKPALGTFNLHASLLPQYRGAAPINRAIMNGADTTGITTFLINEQIDTGAILLQQTMDIGPDETAGELHDRLMIAGSRLVTETILGLAEGNCRPVDQSVFTIPEKELQTAPKLTKGDQLIRWDREAGVVYNQIRGLSPYPGAVTSIPLAGGDTIIIKILSATYIAENPYPELPPGSMVTDRREFLTMTCLQGAIGLELLQPEARKSMSVRDFLNGFGKRLAGKP